MCISLKYFKHKRIMYNSNCQVRFNYVSVMKNNFNMIQVPVIEHLKNIYKL